MEIAAQDPENPVKLILVNLRGMSVDLLRLAFAGRAEIRMQGSASNELELAALLAERPDVALVGSTGSRKQSDALPYLEQIAEAGLPVRAVVLSENMSQEDVLSFFHRGARGLICQGKTDLPALMKCVVCVSRGQVWADSGQLEQLLCSLSHPHALRVTNMTGDALLSRREEQVLHLLARGLSNRELARTLKLSEHTVKNHLFRIFDKLGVSNRMEAVLYALSRLPQAGEAEQGTAERVTEPGAA